MNNHYITDTTENASRLLTTIGGAGKTILLWHYCYLIVPQKALYVTDVFALTLQFCLGLACGSDTGDRSF